MQPAGGREQVNEEVDTIVWLPLGEARQRVTRGRDRRVLDALRAALT
jgi:predicted NUDIX family NTP pyrophosphohydrolase